MPVLDQRFKDWSRLALDNEITSDDFTCPALEPYPSGLTGVDLFGLPIPRHEIIETVHFVVCDTDEDPVEPGFGIDLVHAAVLNEGVGDGSDVTTAFRTHEQVIFAIMETSA